MTMHLTTSDSPPQNAGIQDDQRTQTSLYVGTRGTTATSNLGTSAKSGPTAANEKILEALLVTDPAQDVEIIERNNDRLIEGSGDWLRMNPTLIDWESSGKSSILWMSGDPGKGKTMLAVSMVKRMTEKLDHSTKFPKILLVYFFCDNKDNRRSSATSILRSFIYQILLQRPDLTHHFEAIYDREEDRLFTSPQALQTLWLILRDLLSSTTLQKVYFIVDALDELDEESIGDILDLLSPFLNPESKITNHRLRFNPDRTCQTKWLFTSRNIDRISRSMELAPRISLEVNVDHVRDAIWKYIDLRVEELQKFKGYSQSLTTYVRDTLRKKSEGTFLYVSVACRELAQPGVRLLTTKSALATMPPGLNPLYHRIMTQVLAAGDADLVEYAKAILRAMVLAVRPLTVQELAIAANLPVEHQNEVEVLYEYIGLCGSFVTRFQDVVYFVHLSVKTYLRSVDHFFCRPDHEYHAQLTRSFLGHICAYGHDTRDEDSLLEYPTSFWMYHARHAESSIDWEVALSTELFSTMSPSRQKWLDAYWIHNNPEWEKQPARFSPLQLASYGGVVGLVTAILSRGDNVDEADSWGHTALIWATKQGHDDTLKILLNHGSNVEKKTHNGLTALLLATINGHQQMVQDLLMHGAQVATVDKLGWTALHHAATHGHPNILVDLLEAGADINAKDVTQQSALQRAALCGHVASIKVLVDWNADISIKDKDNLSLLGWACADGNLDLVAFWIQHSADIEATDNQSWTPLMHASWEGHATVVTYLIENGAKVESKSLDGSTALHLASWGGHAHVVKALLERQANPNSQDDRQETPLQQAAWGGHLGACRVLLKSGADPNTQSELGVTPLHQAASNGHEAVVRVLFEWAADPNALDSQKFTPAARAEENAHSALAELLKGLETKGEEEEDFEAVQLPNEYRAVDPAVCELLNVPLESCIAQAQGQGFSKYTKITAFVGEATHYFMKSASKEDITSTEFIALRSMHATVPSLCPRVLGQGKLAKSEDYFMLMEFVDMTYRPNGDPTGSGLSLAQKLARLHLTPASPPEGYQQAMFGFPVPTYTGPVLQNNEYCASWPKFFAQNRLLASMKLIDDAHGTDRELRDGVEEVVKRVIPRLLGNGHLGGLRGITPVLVHGGLWAGNRLRGTSAAWNGWEDVVVDPSSSYAHSEYELSIMRMFGGFSAGFFNEYHRLVPKTEPRNEYEDRIKLYQLYHYLNHYLAYRGGYKEDSMDIINSLVTKYAELDAEIS